MTKSKKITLGVAVLVILALLVVAFITKGADKTLDCPDCEGISSLVCKTCKGEQTVRGSLWALLPPVIAIGLALITKEVYSSLFVGVLIGGILNSGFS